MHFPKETGYGACLFLIAELCLFADECERKPSNSFGPSVCVPQLSGIIRNLITSRELHPRKAVPWY